MAEKYPSLSSAMSEAAAMVAEGLRPSFNDFQVRRRVFFSRVSLVAIGTLATIPLTFFSSQVHPYVSNFPGAKGLDTDNFAWVRGVRLKIETGIILATGLTDANSKQIDTTAAVPENVAEWVRQVLQQGQLEIKSGDREIISCYGLEHMPAGVGPSVCGAVATTTAATNMNALVINNGAEFDSNMFTCVPWCPLFPGKTISAGVSFQSSAPGGTPPTNAHIVARLELDTVFITPTNNG